MEIKEQSITYKDFHIKYKLDTLCCPFTEPKRTGIKPTKQFDINNYLNTTKINETQKRNEHLKKQALKASISNQLNCKDNDIFKAIDKQLSTYPRSAIGIVSNRQGVEGAGCLIGPNLVLTSASNCFNLKNGTQYHEIVFLPAFLTLYTDQGFRTEKIYYPKLFQSTSISNTKKSLPYNYAVLKIDSQYDLEQYFGSLGYDFDWNQPKKYQQEVAFDQTIKDLQFFECSSDSHLEISCFLTDALCSQLFLITSMKPKSNSLKGGPIIYQDEEGRYLVSAINLGLISPIYQNCQVSLKLRKEMFEQLRLNFTEQLIIHEYIIGVKRLQRKDIPQLILEIETNQKKYLPIAHRISIDLYQNKIGDFGCSFITKANWKNIQELNLGRNEIEQAGCQHLAKAQWPLLEKLSLQWNNINVQGCYHLTSGQWNKLQFLNLSENKIGEKGCEYLSETNWNHMRQLNLGSNGIGARGCKYLSRANWNSMQRLNLYCNKIEDSGCRYLIKASWKCLQTIDLYFNKIGSRGCKIIIKAHWIHLKQFHANENKIREKGCQYLQRLEWKQLQQFSLKYLVDNPISKIGFNYLKKMSNKLRCDPNFKQ